MDNLFHSHRLGQVAWLVNVGAFQHGHVVRQQLQRNGVEDRLQDVVDVWHLYDVRSFTVGHACLFIREDD